MVAAMPPCYLKRLERLEQRRATPAPEFADPLALSRRVGIEPDPWQADVLTSRARQLILLAARQTGKSTTVATLALWTALASASLVLILSPGERQSGLLFRKVVALYRQLGRPVPSDVENRLSLELANGSQIYALPGREHTIRGFSGAALLVVDEAARVVDETYHAIRPMVAVSGGRIVLLSTPWGRRGFFHREWSQGGDGWQRVKVRADQCPRIPMAFLAQERRALPALVYASEYDVEFVEADGQYFADADIDAAISADVRPISLGVAHAA